MSARTFEHSGVAQVVIDNFGSGSVSVGAATEPGKVEGSLDSTNDQFVGSATVRQDRDVLRISMPQGFWRGASAHLRLMAPPGLSFLVKSGSADVTIDADIARSRISSGSGDIRVGKAEDLDCTNGSGNLSADELTGRGARLGTGTGDIRIGRSTCPLSIRSGSGDLDVKEAGDAVRAVTGSGDISVSSSRGSVDLRSGSGSFRIGVAERSPAWLDLRSASGSVDIGLEASGQPAAGEPYVSIRARTASGDISIYRA